MVTLNLSSILSLASLALGSFCLGTICGVWYQKRASSDEASLLVGIWERVHSLGQSVSSYEKDREIIRVLCSDFNVMDERLDVLERDVSLFYKEGVGSITLELPLEEIEKASLRSRDGSS